MKRIDFFAVARLRFYRLLGVFVPYASIFSTCFPLFDVCRASPVYPFERSFVFFFSHITTSSIAIRIKYIISMFFSSPFFLLTFLRSSWFRSIFHHYHQTSKSSNAFRHTSLRHKNKTKWTKFILNEKRKLLEDDELNIQKCQSTANYYLRLIERISDTQKKTRTVLCNIATLNIIWFKEIEPYSSLLLNE